MNQYLLAFITGLTSGGISCLVLQGGLLTSVISSESEKYKSTSLFLISKLTIYTALGALLGFFGQNLNIPIKAQGIIQIVIGLFLILTAGRILNIHPLLNYTVLQPPVFILRKIKNLSKNKNFITPIVLGASTILIPCGVTQAMIILALGSGNFLTGALLMFFFTLGTLPVFFALGLTIVNLLKNNFFSKLTALIIIFIGLQSINNGQILRNSPHTFKNYLRVITNNKVVVSNPTTVDGIQVVKIVATNTGYTTNTKTIKKGVPVKLVVESKNVQSCARSFVLPSLGISKLLPVNGQETIEFIPNDEGVLNFSCGMGMYTGSFDIVK